MASDLSQHTATALWISAYPLAPFLYDCEELVSLHREGAGIVVNPCEMFGEYVFDDSLMQKRLPKETYNALKRTIEQGRSLDPAVAGVVAASAPSRPSSGVSSAVHASEYTMPLNNAP